MRAQCDIQRWTVVLSSLNVRPSQRTLLAPCLLHCSAGSTLKGDRKHPFCLQASSRPYLTCAGSKRRKRVIEMPEIRAAAARAADAAPGPATPVRLSICTLPTLSLNTQTPLSQPTSVIASVTASVTTAVTAATISVSNAIRSDLHSTYNGRLSARGAKSRCAHMPTCAAAEARPTSGRPWQGGLGISHQPARSRPGSRRS